MFLRNKKTGEVIEWDKNLTYKLDREYTSLKELCENYEDCEEPKEYWGIDYTSCRKGGIEEFTYDNDNIDEFNKSIGNYFETEEKAEKAVEWLKARKVLFDDTKGFKPNWENPDEKKWEVYYGFWNGQLCTEWKTGLVDYGPHFATKEDAMVSIREHEKEWKIYLGVEE